MNPLHPTSLGLSALTDADRVLVQAAFVEGEDREAAILVLEDHLANHERTPELLLALAVLTYEDAASLVLSQLARASGAAVDLLDEALAAQESPRAEVIALRDTFARTLERERARERRLLELLTGPRDARPTELVELAHRILMSGEDDQLAADLMDAAVGYEQNSETT